MSSSKDLGDPDDNPFLLNKMSRDGEGGAHGVLAIQ